jgi:3-hydroxyisobutyrate dehydrogenase
MALRLLQADQDLAKTFDKKGHAFLDAPVAGSRPQADAGQLIFFVGGPSQALERVQPLLAVMGGAIRHAGENGAGATVKLMINVLFGAQLAVLAETICFAKKSGIDAAKAIEIIGDTPVCSPAAKLASSAMLAGAFKPAFPIELVAKDFALVAGSAAGVEAHIPVSSAVHAVYDNGVEAGLGGDNITGIIQLYHMEK